MTREPYDDFGVAHKLFTTLLSLTGYMLAVVWYGWRLAVVIFVCSWGQNMGLMQVIRREARLWSAK